MWNDKTEIKQKVKEKLIPVKNKLENEKLYGYAVKELTAYFIRHRCSYYDIENCFETLSYGRIKRFLDVTQTVKKHSFNKKNSL